jgi:hypothetical protein
MKHLGMQHPLLTASITKGVLSKERVICYLDWLISSALSGSIRQAYPDFDLKHD